MVLKCLVKLLDGSDVAFEVPKDSKARSLLDDVCKYINIVEKDYFGLISKQSSLQRDWLNLDKKIRKQVNKKSKLEFEFAVKFYPSDPIQLEEGITRYQLCLQIHKDLARHLECSADKLASLFSYWLKSEYEQTDITAVAVSDCLKEIGNSNDDVLRSDEFADRVLSLYQSNAGMTRDEADNQFLVTAGSLRLYGVHFYEGQDSSGNDILIGISSKGVTEKRSGQVPVLHSWSRIKNIVHKKRKFKLKLLRAPANGDPRLKKSFVFDSEEQVQLLWKSAIDHHIFFRVGDKDSGRSPKRKRSILRRLSSSKKSPKTEFDARSQSKDIKRPPPAVNRSNSLRKAASSRRSAGVPEETEPKVIVPEGNNVAIPTLEKNHLKPQESPEVVDDLRHSNFNESVATKSQTKYDYTDMDEESPADVDEEEREYRDDDIADIVYAVPEGSAAGGSSTLLLAETIVEEDEEEDHQYPSPRKATLIHDSSLVLDDNELIDKSENAKNKALETDLDADILLRPTGNDPPEFVDEIDQYSEEWEDLQVTHTPVPLKDVRFLTNDESDDQVEMPKVDRASSVSSYEVHSTTSDDETPHTISGNVGSQIPLHNLLQSPEFDAGAEATESRAGFVDDGFMTIKEYIPRPRKESTEESDIDSVDVPRARKYSTEESDIYSDDVPRARKDSTEESDIYSDDVPRARKDSKEKSDIDSVDACHAPDEQGQTNTGNITTSPAIPRDYVPQDDHDRQSLRIDRIPLTEDTSNKKDPATDDDDSCSDPKSSQNSPIISVKKESYLRATSRSLGIDFRVGDAYKPVNSTKSQERNLDGAASTTAATIGDEDDAALQELDEDILYGDGYSNGEAGDEEDNKASDHSDDGTDRPVSHDVIFKPTETVSPAVEPFKNELEAKSAERTNDGAASTTAATIGDDDVLSIHESDEEMISGEIPDELPNINGTSVNPAAEYKFGVPQEIDIPKLTSDSRTSSLSIVTDDTDELLDTNALERAWRQGAQLQEDDELFRFLFRSPPKRRKSRNKSQIDLVDVTQGKQQAMAFRTNIDEEPISPRRRKNLAKRPFIPSWPFDPMSLISSLDLEYLDPDSLDAAIAAQSYLMDEEKRLEDMAMLEDNASLADDEEVTTQRAKQQEFLETNQFDDLAEKIKVRSRSPSASPRMIGAEFIPGVPDFVHSVVPYQLLSPVSMVKDSAPVQMDEKSPSDEGTAPATEVIPPTSEIVDPIVGTSFSSNTVELTSNTGSQPENPEKLVISDAAQPTESSGRSTPSGFNSLSEGTSSSNSKSSGSSFPRFVHSVFPLRRTSEERRGRSKTRRKREKKITKQKIKKVARSKSRDKKASKSVPSIEVTSAPPVAGFKAFPILSPPVYSDISSPFTADDKVMKIADSVNAQTFYDQESLDKITLSDSDDAHSKPKTSPSSN